jgi:hypothetical protein
MADPSGLTYQLLLLFYYKLLLRNCHLERDHIFIYISSLHLPRQCFARPPYSNILTWEIRSCDTEVFCDDVTYKPKSVKTMKLFQKSKWVTQKHECHLISYYFPASEDNSSKNRSTDTKYHTVSILWTAYMSVSSFNLPKIFYKCQRFGATWYLYKITWRHIPEDSNFTLAGLDTSNYNC